MHSNVTLVLEFLADLYESGRSFSSINIHRSMLSSTLEPVNETSIGQHQLVRRLLQSIYVLNPPKPKYVTTWDLNLILKYLSSLGPNENLELKNLSHKLAVLLALSTFLRVSEIASIERSSIIVSESDVQFSLGKPRKTQKSGRLSLFSLKRLPDPLLCPVNCLGYYVYVTDPLRSQNSNHLLISNIKPYHSVTSTSLAIWIKSVLLKAGISNEFGAHSTRGAASSKAAAAGIPIEEILKRADWAKESTFSRYYKRRIASSIDSVILSRRLRFCSRSFKVTLKVERKAFAYNCWIVLEIA